MCYYDAGCGDVEDCAWGDVGGVGADGVGAAVGVGGVYVCAYSVGGAIGTGVLFSLALLGNYVLTDVCSWRLEIYDYHCLRK